MRLIGVMLILVALLLPFWVAYAQEEPQEIDMTMCWPNYQGPDGKSISNETGINKDWANNPPQLLWKVDMTEVQVEGGYAGPCAVDGKVYIIDHEGIEGIVRALSLETGEALWSFRYADSADKNFGFARSTPAFSEGKLYVTGRLGQLYCLDANTGERIWSHDLVAEFGARLPGWLYAGSPLIDGDRVVVNIGSEEGYLAVFNKLTGEVIWTGGGADPMSYGSPIKATVLEQDVYIVPTGNSFIGVNIADGELVWRIPWANKHQINASTPIIEGNFILASAGYGLGSALYEITPDGPVQYWESMEFMPKFNSAVFMNGYLFGISENGNFVCLSPQDGSLAWKQGGFEWGGIIGIDGVLIAMDGKSGSVVMVDAVASGYREIGRIQPLGGQSWTAPIVCDGKLIVRNQSAVACLNIK